MNVQVINDNHRRIRALHVGNPGCCADITVYRQMDVCLRPHVYFANGEYLLADSHYPWTTTTVPVYKGAIARREENRQFNMCAAHVRVINENTIGVWKSRFGSLRELRSIIREQTAATDVKRICDWVIATAVLHNLLIDLDDPWPIEEGVAVNGRTASGCIVGGIGDETEDPHEANTREGFEFRENVKNICLDIQREQADSFLNFRLGQEEEELHGSA